MAVRLTVRRALGTALVATLVGILLAAAAPATAARAPKYSRPGPYAAAVTTLDLGDRAVEVWYPAVPTAAASAAPARFDLIDKVPPAIAGFLPAGASIVVETDAFRDVPAATKRGGFPLVLMAHGNAGYREQLHYLGAHLASWGFVVASPDILERGLGAQLGIPPSAPVDDLTTMRATESLVRAESARAGGRLEGRVAPDRVAVVGQSTGGTTALRFGSEAGVVTAVSLSAGGTDDATGSVAAFPGVPVMFVTGAADSLEPVAAVQAGFAAATPPTRLVVIEGAGLANLAGICPIGGAGGLVGLARANRLPVPSDIERLVSDGCVSPAPDPDPTWAPVDQAVTAQLREAFGIDRRPRGLDQRTFDKFAPIVVKYQERR